MDQVAALRLAVELIHMPSRVRVVRYDPLPDGVGTVLEIAAGEEGPTLEAATYLDRSPQVLREASAFYIEQILLASDADSYRVLGAGKAAPSSELRRNMALLLRWLHPDKDANADRAIFAGRVTRAWEDLKTPERRAAYDAQLTAASGRSRGSGRGGASGFTASRSRGRNDLVLRPRATGLVARVLHFLLGSSRH